MLYYITVRCYAGNGQTGLVVVSALRLVGVFSELPD